MSRSLFRMLMRCRTVCKSLEQELINSHFWQMRNGTDHVLPGVHPLALSRIWGLLPTAHFLSVDFSCPPEKVRGPRHPLVQRGFHE